MSSRRRLILVLAAVCAAVLSGGAYAYWHFLIRGPFIGATSHDFGDVPLYGDTAKVEHTFHLTNRFDSPLTIVAVRPECGCLSTPDLKRTVQPGDSFDVPVTMIVNHEGRKVIVRIVFEDGRTAALRVEAQGKYQPRLSTNTPAAALREDGTAEVDFSLYTYDTFDDPIPPVIVATPDGLTAEFLEWRETARPQPQFNDIAPTIWQGRARVRLQGDAAGLPANAAIEINYPKAQTLSISIRPVGSVIPDDSKVIAVPAGAEPTSRQE